MQFSLLEGVLKAVRTGIIVFDADERIVFWNAWMEQHSLLPAPAVKGKTFGELFPDMTSSRAHIAVRAALHNNFASLLSQTLHKAPFPLFVSAADAAAGLRMQQAVHVMPLAVDGLPRHCLVQITDVSMAVSRERKLREMADELESQTLVDGMTGIANRRRFDLHLEDEFRRAKRGASAISLIMIDVDYFKRYNDCYGHQQGDACLAQIAGALSDCMHRSRDLVARYGGEEFAAVLPDTDEEGALQVAQCMRAAVEALAIDHKHSEIGNYVTVSLGVSTAGSHALADAGRLIHAADQALYRAKRSGRNCIMVHPENAEQA